MKPDLDAAVAVAEKHLAEGPPYVKHLYETVNCVRHLVAYIRKVEAIVNERNEKLDQMVEELPDETAAHVFVAMRKVGLIK